MEQYSNKKFSLFEFNNLEANDENKYELIDEIVLMSPRPNYIHQQIMSRLNLEIGTYLKEKKCMVFSEVELEFDNNVIIPDLSIICGLNDFNIQRYKKAPELVIEIISPGSQYTDTFTKLYKYELFGVKEYWIANPKTEIITVYNFENKTNKDYGKHEKLISSVFNDLEINLSEILF
jgi:Uma2 family endonuclease